jgi:hypothetical protein
MYRIYPVDPSMKRGWYLFNDISCTPAQSDEPIRFDSQWRRPSILIFGFAIFESHFDLTLILLGHFCV